MTGWTFKEILSSDEFTKEEKLSIILDFKNNIGYLSEEDAVVIMSLGMIINFIQVME